MLREAGDLVDAEAVPLAEPVSPVVLVSRALCRFRFLPTMPGVSAQEAMRAALLHAEGHAPFAAADCAVYRTAAGFELWWWDRARVEALVGGRWRYDPQRLVPESMGNVAGEGLRQLQTADGFEAQYLVDNSLRASQWRRRPFDALQWRAFAESAGVDPGEAGPPAPVQVQWRRDVRARGQRVLPGGPWRRVEQAGWAGAALSLAIAMAFGGHAMQHRIRANTDLQWVAAQTEAAAAPAGLAFTDRNIALARAAAARAAPPEHLIAAADVLAAMREVGADPDTWRSDGVRVYAASKSDAAIRTEDIAALLKANPRLRDVAPLREDGAIVVTAAIRPSNASLADGAP